MNTVPPGKTADTRWQRLQELFSTAVELPESERQAFVERETVDDLELREELLGLVACDTGKSTGPLTHALGNALDSTTRDRRRALLGKTVGNYKLVSVLGHGGTGTVYLGERADRQYSAQVAVKIVDSATVHGDLGLRFRAERQILASLNHINIARLLDAGETTEGQPYLVMEYVHGEPVDRYCDRAQLDLRGRLNLFLEICSAVQYAHQNLIVHRDLKPANILVTLEGAPKLLDFGIAKLLDVGDSAAMLALTRMNDRLLTPEYASPEQILGRAVTTASDVYALGVVLYELLTGLRPYVVPASASQLELERSICVSDPQRPSAAVRRSTEAGPVDGQSPMPAIATARGVTPERLHKRLVGDLDAIIMRALRKEPQHRYGSIEQLTADIRRYLTREPVQARQGNWLYYSQRFMRRHAFGVSVTATFVMVVLVFAIVMSVQRARIAAELYSAQKVSDLMVNMFGESDPYNTAGSPLTAEQLLDDAAGKITVGLEKQPLVRARLLEAIGRAYRRQGRPKRGIPFLKEAISIRGAQDLARNGTVVTELAIALRDSGELDKSDVLFQQAKVISQSNPDEKSSARAHMLVDLGRLEQQRSHLPEAEKYFLSGLAMTIEIEGSNSTEVASILSQLTSLRAWQDDLDGAEKFAREAIAIYSHSGLTETQPDRIMADARLAEVLFLKGSVNDAGERYEYVLARQQKLYGGDSKPVADTLDALARVRLAQNEPEEAEKLTRQAVGILERFNEDGKPFFPTGYLRTSLAQILLREKKYADAEAEILKARAIYDVTLEPDHQYIASAEYLQGEILLGLHRYGDAEAVLTASMNRWKRTPAPAWRSARSASALGEVLYREKKPDDAEKYLIQGFQELRAASGADPIAVQQARERLQQFYLDRGERQKLDQLQLAVSHDESATKNSRPN